MNIFVYPASGRATCKLCYKLIKKNTTQVNIVMYQSAQNAHIKCIDKKLKGVIA